MELYLSHHPDAKGYIICKEEAHLANWEEDIIEHDKQFINSRVKKFLYDSLHKYDEEGFVDFVILDEAHALTDKRLAHLKKIVGSQTLLIMLSATVDGMNEVILKQLSSYYEYHISISEAIERGILPPPIVYIHMHDLDNSKKWIPYITEDGNEIECTELGAYRLTTVEVDTWKAKYDETSAEWARIKMVNAGSRRKRLMAEIKTNIARELIKNEFENSRFICFTGSKNQCNELGKSYAIHSGKSKKANTKRREDFNNGYINKLFVVNMFKEAMNLVNIQKGLIVQLDNVKLSFIQMLGRVFRSSLPEMHIIVLKNTKDEHYLKNVMEGFNQEYVKTIIYESNKNL